MTARTSRLLVPGRWLLLAAAAYLPSDAALAHFMTQPYLLPVPFWMYAYGCAATLVLTFAVLGYFSATRSQSTTVRSFSLSATGGWSAFGKSALVVLRIVGFAWLLLTLATSIFGTRVATENAAMSLFWIILMLALTYLCALVGDLYELMNPWRTLVELLEKVGIDFSTPRIAYPAWLGYYPAFLAYVWLIWMELFSFPDPRTLAWALVWYTGINVVASWIFGKAAWFRFGEMFAVFFRMIGTLAVVGYEPTDRWTSWRVRLRAPFVGALAERPESMGLVLFVLFMLASTTYDGIHDTEMWINLYWQQLIYFAQPLWGPDASKAEKPLMAWFQNYKEGGLLLSPVLYFLLYLLVMAWTKAITKTTLSIRALSLEFVTTLIPIAFVYNVSHYYTLLLLEGGRLPYIFNDPFGFGWSLFGLERYTPTYIDMAIVWHTQVALILGGHMVSVYLAHRVALGVFPTRKQAILSQIPMLLLMVAYTAIGLYVLSLPLALRQLREG